MFTNYFDVKIVARGSLSHGMNGMNKNDFFSKTRRIAPKTGRNRLVLTLIVSLQSLVALALPERPLETWFHFRIKKLIPEYPRMWNQMIRFLRHFRVVEMVLRCRGMFLLTILTSKLSPEAP